MKILFVLPSLGSGPGGSEKVISQIASALAEDPQHEVSLFTPLRREHYLDGMHQRVRYESANRRRAISCLPIIAGKLRSNEFDVVISSAYVNLVCGLARRFVKTRSRLIARETTIPSVGVNRWRFPRLIRALYRYVYPVFDGIICQSSDMANDLVEFAGVSQEKVRVIHNPYFPPGGGQNAEADGKWFSSSEFPNDIVFTAVGKFTEQKNLHFALQALAKLSSEHWRLNLVGDGPQRSMLQEMVTTHGLQEKVRMKGVSGNVEHILRNSDYLLLVSLFEGLSNSMIEAVCNQVPVVAIPAPGGIQEILSEIPGCLVASNIDIGSLQEVLMKCRKGVRIAPEFAQKFNSKRIVAEYSRYADDVTLADRLLGTS